MSFVPAIPTGGLAGWRFLERTETSQRAAFARDPVLQRDLAQFRERIGSIRTAEELVADRTLLKVALGAFGLEADLDKRAFLRKVLEEGTERPDAFAVRLVDRRYREFSRAFGFGDAGGPWTRLDSLGRRVAAAYEARGFEVAVGTRDETLRLALNFRRAIGEVTRGADDRTNWLQILGDRPVREVLAQALGLPSAVAGFDVDAQVALLRDRASRLFGVRTAAELAAPAATDGVIRRFLARAEAEAGPSAGAPGAAALTLLRGAAGPLTLAGLLAARA